MPVMRDYLYLDGQKLQDYSAGIDLGNVQSVREIARRNRRPGAGPETPMLGTASMSGSVETEEESTRERVLSISDRDWFSAFYTAVKTDMPIFEEDVEIDFDQIGKNELVEIVRDFSRSPINAMFESITEMGTLIQRSAGLPGVDVDQAQVQQTMTMLELMTNSNQGDTKTVPMLSDPISDGDVPVLFLALESSLMVATDDFEGEMTLVGKIAKKVMPGKAVDLIDELKILPRSLRRMKDVSGGPREGIVTLLSTLPESLGGPVPASALSLQGPAAIVTPLAVFR
jgi:hypothetical protein